ncbi:MAG: alpha/beta hydrolase family protein [Aeromicrobium sp.]
MKACRQPVAALSCLLALVLIVSGCSWMGDQDKPSAAPPKDWATVKTTSDDAGILIQKVTYRSGDLTIDGQVCRPTGRGPHPVLIWNHGGFAGLDDWNNPGGFCAVAARSGWVLAESSYRGEDGSDGEIEICLGEVDDSLSLLETVLDQSYADADRVAMVGVSHGGCITTRAVQQGAPVQLAVDVAGPSDWAELWTFMNRAKARPSTPANVKSVYSSLLETVETAIGGTPAEHPERYAERSPIHKAGSIAQDSKAFLIVHGGADVVVPIQQSCDLATRIGDVRAYRFDRSGAVASQPVAGCEDLPWRGPPTPVPAFVGDRYLLVYDGVDHLLVGKNSPRVRADFLEFMAAKLTG